MYRVRDFQPLVRKGRLLKQFSFQNFPPPASSQAGKLSVLKLLDVFLRVIGKSWDAKLLSAELPDLLLFVGALSSPCFIPGDSRQRYHLIRSFYQFCLRALDESRFESFSQHLDYSSEECTPWCAEQARRFENHFIPANALPYIRGWPSKNLAGRTTWWPLEGVALKLGAAFTDELHRAADSYYSKRRAQQIPGFKDLCTFIAQYPAPLTPANLLEPGFAAQFWMAFHRSYFQIGVANGLGIGYLVRNWGAEFVPFAEGYLFHAKLFTRPSFGVPAPKPKNLQDEIPHAQVKDGVTSIHKLLVPVPMEASDQEAMDILFKHLSLHSRTIERWAQAEVDDLDLRIDRRESLASKGKPREVGPSYINNGATEFLSPRNPKRAAHVAATFQHYGYGGAFRFPARLLYPTPLADTAEWLGLPKAGALLPHCALLVIDHPEITPSFLENFELYNDRGQLCGYLEGEGQALLDGFKRRKGVAHAQQQIRLSERAAKTVKSIIRATAPLREYLQQIGDDNWRFLLLSSGKSFAHPQRVLRLATYTSHRDRVSETAQRIAQLVPDAKDIAEEVAQNFALPPLRATQGVLALINGATTAEMARRLGHTDYSPKLLARYLPEPLLHFFQHRWIRLFQEGLILHAMSGSPLLLEASSFRTAAEIDAFLLRHCLTPPPESNCGIRKAPPVREALIQVDATTLGVLRSAISYADANRARAPGTVKFWSAFGERLFKAIESSPREDLKAALRASKKRPKPVDLPWGIQ